MMCECPYKATHHNPNHCPNKAVYTVSRPIGEEIIEVRVCPECKMPEDFNVREIK